MSTPPHNNNNNNNNQNNSNANNTSSNNNNPSANNASSYYDTHNVFPASVNNNNQDTILYDSITTLSQAQNTLYAPSIGTAIGKFIINFYFTLTTSSLEISIEKKILFVKYEQNVSKISSGSGSFTSLAPLTMQDIKLNATTTLIDQSMSPYHAGEDAFFGARINNGKEAQFCSQHKFTQINSEFFFAQ